MRDNKDCVCMCAARHSARLVGCISLVTHTPRPFDVMLSMAKLAHEHRSPNTPPTPAGYAAALLQIHPRAQSFAVSLCDHAYASLRKAQLSERSM